MKGTLKLTLVILAAFGITSLEPSIAQADTFRTATLPGICAGNDYNGGALSSWTGSDGMVHFKCNYSTFINAPVQLMASIGANLEQTTSYPGGNPDSCLNQKTMFVLDEELPNNNPDQNYYFQIPLDQFPTGVRIAFECARTIGNHTIHSYTLLGARIK